MKYSILEKEILTYDDIMNLLAKISIDSKCIVQLYVTQLKGTKYSNDYCNDHLNIGYLYFDQDNKFIKYEERDHKSVLLNPVQMLQIRKTITAIKRRGYITDMDTTLIPEDCKMRELDGAEIVSYIKRNYDEFTKLDDIVNNFNTTCSWYTKDIGSVDSLLTTELTRFFFGSYDNDKSTNKDFDFVRIEIPVKQRNNSYDTICNYIKENNKEVNSIVVDLLKNRLAKRHLPVGIMKFNSAILTRQFILVYTFSVKELKEEENNV